MNKLKSNNINTIDFFVNSGRNGSGALCAEHDRKVRGPRVQTCHVVLGSCVNAVSQLKNLHLKASISKTIICSSAYQSKVIVFTRAYTFNDETYS